MSTTSFDDFDFESSSTRWAPPVFGTLGRWLSGFPLLQRPRLPNPGRFEDLNRDSHEFQNENFDGLRVEYSRIITPNLMISHTFQLASYDPRIPPAYHISAAYATESRQLFGRLETDEFRLSGAYIQSLPYDLEFKLQSAILPETDGEANPMMMMQMPQSSMHLYLNRKGEESWSQVRYEQGAFGANHIQSISKNLAIGLDMSYYHQMLAPQFTLGGKFQWNNEGGSSSYFTVLANMAQVALSFYHKPTPHTRLSSEFVLVGTQEGLQSVTLATIEFKQRQATYRAQFSTMGKGTLSYTHMFLPNLKFNFFSEIDWFRDACRIGLGIAFQA